MYATCRVHLGVTDFCSNPTSTRECRDWACPVPERHSDINIQTLPLTLVTASLSLSSEPHIEMSFLVCQNVCALALMSCDLNWCFCHSLIVLFLFLSSYIALIYFLFLPTPQRRSPALSRPTPSPLAWAAAAQAQTHPPRPLPLPHPQTPVTQTPVEILRTGLKKKENSNNSGTWAGPGLNTPWNRCGLRY